MNNSKLEYPEQQLVEMKLDKNDEQILVFEKKGVQSLLDEALANDGVTIDNEGLLQELNVDWENYGTVKRRGDVEEDTNYIQPIPAIIVKRGEELFLYKRLEGSGEKRLVGKQSLTIGGHANMVEEYWNFQHLMAVNAKRELEEEVFILDDDNNEIDAHFDLAKNAKVLGLAYNNRTEVDSVHLGIFLLVEVSVGTDVKVKETEVLKGEFVKIDDIDTEALENWSKDVLKILK